MKRIFDFLSSLMGILILFPILFIIGLLIFASDRGSIFYVQQRVGKGNKDFGLFKFRSMVLNADKLGQLTVGERDPRITKIGFFLRKYKLDELPQLLNILFGTMSVVGPRPEVRKYVAMYSEEQAKVLSVKPGLTDYASIEYMDENKILGAAENPEQLYIDKVMPEKLLLNMKYLENQSLLTDLKIIFATIGKIISR